MPSGALGGRQVRPIPPGTTIHPHHGLLRPDLAVQKSSSAKYHRWALRLMQYDMDSSGDREPNTNSPMRDRDSMA